MTAIPPGYWLAPVEPTEAMIEAWVNAGPTFPTMALSDLDANTVCAQADWLAMRDAAPPAPVAQPASSADVREACAEIARSEAGIYAEDGEGDAWIALRIEKKIRALPLPDPQPDTTAALVEALEDLESTATVVANFGAQTGAQWLRMAGSLIKARAALAAHRSAQTGEPK